MELLNWLKLFGENTFLYIRVLRDTYRIIRHARENSLCIPNEVKHWIIKISITFDVWRKLDYQNSLLHSQKVSLLIIISFRIDSMPQHDSTNFKSSNQHIWSWSGVLKCSWHACIINKYCQLSFRELWGGYDEMGWEGIKIRVGKSFRNAWDSGETFCGFPAVKLT